MTTIPNIGAMAREELIALNKRIVERVRQLDRIRQIDAGSKFVVGMLAEFTESRYKQRVRICITKINAKTVNGYEIDEENRALHGRTWKVPPSMLTRVVSNDKPATAAETCFA